MVTREALVEDSEVVTNNLDGVASNTDTVFDPVLFPSLLSGTLFPGSTVAVFARLAVPAVVTLNAALNDAFAGKVTGPFATQVRVVPAMEQSIVPVGAGTPLIPVTGP